MATKTKKILQQHLEDFYKFRWEALKRNPEYREDYERWREYSKKLKVTPTNLKLYERSITKLLWERNKFEDKCRKKYKILSMVDPDDCKHWWHTDYRVVAKIIPQRVKKTKKDIEIDKLLRLAFDKRDKKAEKEFMSLCRKRCKDNLKYALRNNRYLTLEIDTSRDKEVIMHHIEKCIDYIIEEKKKKNIRAEFDKTPHLDKYQRYFKVFDFRNQRPPLKYDVIASKLSGEGYYKDKNFDKVIYSVRKDYQVAFCWIFGAPYKEYDKAKFKKSNFESCKSCPKRNNCKEPCADLEYVLSQGDVKQKHYIGYKDIGEWNNI